MCFKIPVIQVNLCQGYYHREAESARDLIIVVVSFLDLWLASSKVGADEADAGGVEQQTDGYTSFIACSPAHSSLYSIYSNIPGKHTFVTITVLTSLVSNENVYSSYLMKGACCGRMKTNRHTPTSCSEASSTYLWSRDMFFCSSAAQSFWLVVLKNRKMCRKRKETPEKKHKVN